MTEWWQDYNPNTNLYQSTPESQVDKPGSQAVKNDSTRKKVKVEELFKCCN
jgi:hypothetical protein